MDDKVDFSEAYTELQGTLARTREDLAITSMQVSELYAAALELTLLYVTTTEDGKHIIPKAFNRLRAVLDDLAARGVK